MKEWNGYKPLNEDEISIEEEDLESAEVLHGSRPVPFNPWNQIGRLLATIHSLRADRDKLQDDLIELDIGYCPVCGSCGEPGCCDPSHCKTVQGLYCESNKKEWRDVMRDNEMLLGALQNAIDCLVEGDYVEEAAEARAVFSAVSGIASDKNNEGGAN